MTNTEKPVAAWSPSQYLKFEDERSRPARDLLAAVPLTEAARIVDIGCGPGNSTEILAARYPGAAVVGLDSSAEMLVEARKRLPQLSFVEADVARWEPEAPQDLFFSNAVFQWVPGHLDVVARLLGRTRVIALQVPDNLGEPSHVAMRETAADGPWRDRFATPVARETIPAPEAYYNRLKPEARAVDIWRTVYCHILAAPEAIVEWVMGTGLRPFLARLDPADRPAFLAAYAARIAAAYPPLADGRVMLRFPRLFVVAAR